MDLRERLKLLNDAKELLSKGRIEKTLLGMQAALEGFHDSEYSNKTRVQSARYHKLTRSWTDGDLEREDYDVKIVGLTQSLFKLIQDFEDDYGNSPEEEDLGLTNTEPNSTFHPNKLLCRLDREPQDDLYIDLTNQYFVDQSKSYVPIIFCDENAHYPDLFLERLCLIEGYQEIQYQFPMSCPPGSLESVVLKKIKTGARKFATRQKAEAIKKSKSIDELLSVYGQDKFLLCSKHDPLDSYKLLKKHHDFWNQQPVSGKKVLCVLLISDINLPHGFMSKIPFFKNRIAKVKNFIHGLKEDIHLSGHILPELEEIKRTELNDWKKSASKKNSSFRVFLTSESYRKIERNHRPPFNLKPFGERIEEVWFRQNNN